MTIEFLPKLTSLPSTLPLEGSVAIDLESGVPILRASTVVQNRIDELLAKQQESTLTIEEEREFDCYEEIDDYLSFINRMIRNIALAENHQS
jgi:hypothetical protein